MSQTGELDVSSIIRQNHRADMPIYPRRVKLLVPGVEVIERRLAERDVLDMLTCRQARAPPEHDNVQQAVAHQTVAAVHTAGCFAGHVQPWNLGRAVRLDGDAAV